MPLFQFPELQLTVIEHSNSLLARDSSQAVEHDIRSAKSPSRLYHRLLHIPSSSRRLATMISPFGNVTVLPEAKWNPEPTVRGTFSILSSCLITMALCIWTAVHLNLPQHKKESREVYRRFFWLVLGLLAPEVIVFIAWNQRVDMRLLSHKMRKLGFMADEIGNWEKVQGWPRRALAKTRLFPSVRAKKPAGPRQGEDLCHGRVYPWTDVHSWYALMGGLAFEDTSAEEFQFMPGGRQRLTFTDDVVLWMARHRPRVLPDISRQHIEDKSKSGGLGKILTCWQATYFCIQCIFRLSQQYTISLLELNVFAHAVCALVVFWVWWDKPQDVREPTLITDKEGLEVCAYFDVSESSPVGYYSSRWVPRQRSTNFYDIRTPTTSRPVTVAVHRHHCSHLHSIRYRFSFGSQHRPCLRVLDTFWTIEVLTSSWDHELVCTLDSRTVRRLAKAYGLVTKYGRAKVSPTLFDRCGEVRWSNHSAIPNLSSIPLGELFTSGFSHVFWAIAGVTLAGGCYGGLHLTAWTCQFPSYAATLLWRAASVTILATGPAAIAYILWQCTLGTLELALQDELDEALELDTYWAKYVVRPLRDFMNIVRFPLFSSWIIWYTLCRAFLVVECFIMLAHLPDSALEIPRWATYIPHIT